MQRLNDYRNVLYAHSKYLHILIERINRNKNIKQIVRLGLYNAVGLRQLFLVSHKSTDLKINEFIVWFIMSITATLYHPRTP